MPLSSVRFCQRRKAQGTARMFSWLLVAAFFIVPVDVVADTASDETHSNPDGPGFSVAADENLFSPNLNFYSRAVLDRGKDIQSSLATNLEIEMLPDIVTDPDSTDALDSLATNYQPQGQIKRLSTSWNSGAGLLTVGSDWANFQDLVSMDKSPDGSIDQSSRSVTSQIKWVSPNGFSIALENPPSSQQSVYLADESESSRDLFESSPSIILSWRRGAADHAGGEYRVTAMGNKLNANASGQKFDGSDLTNWGLNLEGGWQIGDLFSALSMTFGKGIDSYLLQKFDNDILVTPNEETNPDEQARTGASFGIQPSLYYSLNDHSTFHVALGHYSTAGADDEAGIDTLDTIHIGYSWNPWPSTRFGLQLRDQSAQGAQGESQDTQVKFEAAKQF